MKNLIFVIPLYNEANNLAELLERIKESVSQIDNVEINKIILVNDGSKDETYNIIEHYKKDREIGSKIDDWNSKRNFGGNHSVYMGYKIANKIVDDNSIIIRMDADLEHQPEDLNKLIKPIIDNGKVSLSVGCIPYDKRSGHAVNFINYNLGYRLNKKVLGLELGQFCPGYQAIKGDFFKEMFTYIEYCFREKCPCLDFFTLFYAKMLSPPQVVLLLPIEDKKIKKIGLIKTYKYYKMYEEIIEFADGFGS